MNLKLIHNDGSLSSFDAPDFIFSKSFNTALVHQVLISVKSNLRLGTRAQKDRSEVKHSTKKPWRQKGTGRARAGMTSSPLWRGGGRVFPSSSDENFSKKINKKMYRAAICSILSQLAREDRLLILDALFQLELPRTKEFVNKLSMFGTASSKLIISNEINSYIRLASRNLPSVLLVEPHTLNPVNLVNYQKILITRDALNQLEEILR